jgi:alpha-amylase
MRLAHLARAASLWLVIASLWPAMGHADPAVDNNLVYQIFVRSFADSNGDGTGDLNGIGAKLDEYLNDGKPQTDHDLEVGILWLMPIFPADSYHGYNVKDYEAVEPKYGTLDDLRTLVQQAHDRGVRIILDIPFNHTSSNHKWFQMAVAGDSAMQNRYHFRSADHPLASHWYEIEHNGTKMQYFGLFDRSMPDLNFDNAEVRQEVKNIAGFWLKQGVDGFRLDAAKHIYGDTFDGLSEPQILKNNDFWLEFSNYCYSVNPRAVLVGEVLGSREDLRRHAYGLEALLDKPFMDEARQQMSFPKPGFLARQKEAIRSEREVNGLAPHQPQRPFSTFLFIGSHDENPRLASYLEELKLQGMPATVDEAYRLGICMLLTMGQYPIIYYGQEVMQRGYRWNGNGDGSGIFDETLREPFPWFKSGSGVGQTTWFSPRFDKPNDGVSREEQDTEGGMLHLVRGITNLRTKHPGFANGDVGEILSDTHDWMVFERVNGGDRYLVLLNPTGSGKDYQFHAGWFPRYLGAQLLFWSDGTLGKWKDESSNNAHIEDKAFVPPYGFVLLKEKTSG